MRKLVVSFAFIFAAPSISRAANWVPIATGSMGNFSVEADTESVRKVGNRVKVWLKWQWVTPQDTKNSYPNKTFQSEKELLIIDCVNRSSATAQSVFYEGLDGGSVVESFSINEQLWKFSEAVPESISEAIVAFACKPPGQKAQQSAASGRTPEKKNGFSIHDDGSKELADSVRTVLSGPSINQGPPIPQFASTEGRLTYLKWKEKLDKKLEVRISDSIVRKEFLQTVWYESIRAGVDTALVLSIVSTLSNFSSSSLAANGARGYMAVKTDWATKIGDGDAEKLFQQQANLRFGCVVLRHYLDIRRGVITAALMDYLVDNLDLSRADPQTVRLASQIINEVVKWQ